VKEIVPVVANSGTVAVPTKRGSGQKKNAGG